MNAIRVFLLLAFLTGTASGAEKTGALLEQKFASLLPANAKWALSIIDMETGTETINIGNSVGEAMKPGSLMKLFISGAALEHAGRDGNIDMRTSVLYDGAVTGDMLKGSFYLTGKGNALLSTKDLKNAVDAIQKSGIKRIADDIVADDTLFDTKGLERKRKGPAYASSSALGLDLHTVSVIVTPAEAGKPPVVQIEPPNDSVRFSVSARTVTSPSNTIKIVQMDDYSYSVTGNIPAGTGSVKRRFPLNDPALYAAGSIKALLKQAGITVDGDAKKEKTPDGAKVIAEMNSPAFGDLIKDMNVNSINLLADNLLLLLGEEKFGAPGTYEKGVKAIEEFLTAFPQQPPLPWREGSKGRGSQNVDFSPPPQSSSIKGEENIFSNVKVFDGSGLDERNRVTAGFTANYLYEASKRPWFASFKNSLPKGGEGRLREIGIEDTRFSVKTGMLEDAYALAGYGMDGKGRAIAFSYMVNMPGADVLAVNKHGGEVIQMIQNH